MEPVTHPMKPFSIALAIVTLLAWPIQGIASEDDPLHALSACKKAFLLQVFITTHEQEGIAQKEDPNLLIFALGGLNRIGAEIQTECEQFFVPSKISETSTELQKDRAEWRDAMAQAHARWFSEHKADIKKWIEEKKAEAAKDSP